MKWPWTRAEAPVAYSPVVDIASFFGPNAGFSLDGVAVNERSALSLSAFYRAVSLISGTLASMPMRSYTSIGDPFTPDRRPVRSIFDNPDPEGQTPYEWKETAFAHLLLHGAAGALKVKTEAGTLAALPLVHPSYYTVSLPTTQELRRGIGPVGGLWFDVSMEDGTHERLDGQDFWYVPGLSLNGKTGVSLLEYARRTFATSLSGDKAAGNMFANGAMISGIATPADEDAVTDVTNDIKEIRRQIDNATMGHENAGRIALLNRRLTFQPWTMTAADAQFLQSRQFQIEEIARLTGVPPHLLMQTEKQTSWGTGIEEQNRALGRTVLAPWANRFEERASRLLANPRSVAFDFTALERPSPDKETELDLSQVAAGVMTVDEYRVKRGWTPLPPSEVASAPSARDQGSGQERSQDQDASDRTDLNDRSEGDRDQDASARNSVSARSDRPIAIGGEPL